MSTEPKPEEKPPQSELAFWVDPVRLQRWLQIAAAEGLGLRAWMVKHLNEAARRSQRER